MRKAAITAKQQRFVDEYLVDLNATQAAIRAGYSAKTAQEQSARLLSKVMVQKAVAEGIKQREKRTNVTKDRVVTEAARIGLFDPRKLFREDGTPKPIVELDDDTAAALAGIEVIQVGGEDGPAIIKKYKIADKNSALDKLFRHLGLYEKDNEQINPISALIASIGRSALPVVSDVPDDGDE